MAGLALCGVSGCGGGGFGPAYGGPGSVLPFLIASGVIAALPFVSLAVGGGGRKWLTVALAVAVSVVFLGLVLTGSGLDGYPRSVPHDFGVPPTR